MANNQLAADTPSESMQDAKELFVKIKAKQVELKLMTKDLLDFQTKHAEQQSRLGSIADKNLANSKHSIAKTVVENTKKNIAITTKLIGDIRSVLADTTDPDDIESLTSDLENQEAILKKAYASLATATPTLPPPSRTSPEETDRIAKSLEQLTPAIRLKKNDIRNKRVEIDQLRDRFIMLQLTLNNIKRFAGADKGLSEEAIRIELRIDSEIPKDPKNAQAETSDETCCIICMDAIRRIAFTPCGHLCTCVGCANGLSKCPVCNAKIDKAVKIYNP
jgi:hypothetical protein